MKKIKLYFRNAVLLLSAVMLCSGFAVAGKGYDMYRDALAEMSLEDKVASVREKETFTSYEDLPEVYIDAVISVEDHRFYNHSGIDVIAIGRAILRDIQEGRFAEGGSTITQQLAKNMYFSQDKELTRKVAEVFMAFDMEETYSKEEILELYVNSIYFGDGYSSVGEASQGYFSKVPARMTEYESTLLAGVPNAPSRYAPSKNPELAEKRQLQVLERMKDCGYFSEEEAETVASQMMAVN